MKFRTERRERLVAHVIDGTAHQVPQPYSVRVPVLPRDWDRIALRAAVALVLVLTVATVIWSTWSIGDLLGRGVGFAAAVIFDIGWAVALVLEWLARFDPKKRTFAKGLGWALLAVTMLAIGWHGGAAGHWGQAIFGAAVSAFAKLLWLGVMRFIDRDLSAEDAAWVAAEMSRANAQLAVAGVRRQVAAAEQRAAFELLAAERIRGQLADANTTEHAPLVPGSRTNPQANTPNTQDRPDDTEQPADRPSTVALTPATASAATGQQPSIADLARQQLRTGATRQQAVTAIAQLLPDAKRESIAATVRREHTRLATYP